MVTAGVYLIARTHGLFLMAPEVLHGGHRRCGHSAAGRLRRAGADRHQARARLLHHEPDRLHVPGAGRAGMGRGDLPPDDPRVLQGAAVPVVRFGDPACHHEQNIFKMGGLRKSIPLVYVCFTVGGAALSALPLVTAGFFSKDEIPAGAMANGHINLMVAGFGRCVHDLAVHLPYDFHRVPWRRENQSACR